MPTAALKWYPESSQQRRAGLANGRLFEAREWKAQQLYAVACPLGDWPALSEREKDSWRDAAERASYNA